MTTVFNFLDFEFYCILGLSIANSIALIDVAYKFFHIVQLNGYKLSAFYKWNKQNKCKYMLQIFFLSLLSFGGLLVFNFIFASFKMPVYLTYLGLIFYFSLIFVFIRQLKKANEKTPLKSTARMTRLKVFFFFIMLIISFFIIAVPVEYSRFVRFGTVAFTPFLVFAFFPLIYYVELPIEIIIQKSYIAKAKKRLASLEKIKPKIKIGITGSFGKTSTKIILAEILKSKYQVSYSPASYNTPMGLTKFLLKNVKSDDDVLIAEMGARKPNDIKDLCKIITPDIAIITSVGEQHLETFKTVENVAKTKFEIVQFSKPNAKIFVGDDKELKKIYLKIKKEKYCTSNKKNAGYFAYAQNIKISPKGSTFELVIKNEKFECETKLLGEHNIENIVLASAVAYKLGLSGEEIKSAILTLKPVEHRLQLIKSINGVNILDDSYNSSPQGSLKALNVLSGFNRKTKWVLTPGLVEQGKNQENANFEFGKNIAKFADYAIIVNKINRKALLAGLESGKMKADNIFVADTLEKAKKIMETKLNKNCVLLIENDLPDNFI